MPLLHKYLRVKPRFVTVAQFEFTHGVLNNAERNERGIDGHVNDNTFYVQDYAVLLVKSTPNLITEEILCYCETMERAHMWVRERGNKFLQGSN